MKNILLEMITPYRDRIFTSYMVMFADGDSPTKGYDSCNYELSEILDMAYCIAKELEDDTKQKQL